jgi:hypothetical protein
MKQDERIEFFIHFGRIRPLGPDRAFRSNSSTLPTVKSAVFPLQSLARFRYTCGKGGDLPPIYIRDEPPCVEWVYTVV